MTEKPGILELSVLGPFRLHLRDGPEIEIKGGKNQALLALVALSPGKTQQRRLLEDKLWSSFGPEQASANLRQALSKLRKALGPQADILKSDRSTVSLDPARLRVDLIEDAYSGDERTEVLQGLDARDPEFEDWLRQERTAFERKLSQARPEPARGILIGCRVDAADSPRARMVSDHFANQIGENIAEQVRAWRQAEEALDQPGVPASDFTIRTQLVEEDGQISVFIKAIHQPSARLVYSKMQQFPKLSDVLDMSGAVARIVFEAADQIMGKLPQVLDTGRPESRATALSRLAMYRMFSLDKENLREAGSLMAQAYAHDANGLYLAWSGLIRLTQFLEMSEADRDGLREEAVELQYRAMEEAGQNALVQALVSRVRHVALGDAEGSAILAQGAVEANPASAYAWVSLAEAQMRTGRLQDGLASSARARQIARTSPFRHWFDTGHCVIAIACNQLDEAIEAGEAAARAAPLNRPAHRQLLALYATKGQLDKAQAVATRLGKIEPGFTLDRMVNDESYPVRTLRNKGMLEPLRALL